MLLKFHIQAFLQHAQRVEKKNTDDRLPVPMDLMKLSVMVFGMSDCGGNFLSCLEMG